MPGQRQGRQLQTYESSPLVEKKKKLRRQIYECPESERKQLNNIQPRFGPIYCNNQGNEWEAIKERAWQHVLRNSPEREAITKENYLSAIRQIEDKARDAYDEGKIDLMTGSQFRWMMIKDGCLFLQMGLFILDRSKQLNYPPDDKFFGSKHNAKEIRKWTKSMFFVGNQIPFVVLNQLMKQGFFQQVISGGKWNDLSSNLSERTLYEFLVMPALRNKWHNLFPKGVHWMKEQPVDLIHALHLLVLGPEKDEKSENDDEESIEDDETEGQNEGDESVSPQRQVVLQVVINIDDIAELTDQSGTQQDEVVTGEEGTSGSAKQLKVKSVTLQRQVITGDEDISDDKSCRTATILRQQGMNFETCPSPLKLRRGCWFYIKKPIKTCKYLTIVKWMGSRGIKYVNSFISTALYLPPLLVDGDTEILLQCLKNYEMCQPLEQEKREFSCYLRFLSELISTPEDANLLHSEGIIHGNRRHREKLPMILSKLASKEDKYNQNFRALILKISDYNRPAWKDLRNILSFISLLAVVQTVYTILPYHTGK